MSGSISSLASQDLKTDAAVRQPVEQTRRPAPDGLQAGVLALQDAAGNQAVNRTLRSGGLPPIVREVLDSGSGQPLDPATRREMEARLGHDLSQVRVHTGSQAAQSAEAVQARAYTVGHDLVFGPGEYAPETASGHRLLAHELAHVVQQSRGGAPAPMALPDSPLEQAAHQAADAVVQGQGPVEVGGASAPGLAREEKPGAATPAVPMYKVEVEGKTLMLTEAEYKREVARITHNLGVDFNRIEGTAASSRQVHQEFLDKTHGFWGVVSDIVADTAPPTVGIWSWPDAAIKRGREALAAGNLQGAARQLQLAQQALKDAQQEWHNYLEKTISGAGQALQVAEVTRDVSFAIAIATAAVVAAPVVAGAVATTGLTGAGATVATGAVVTTGGAGAGAVLRGGSSAAGQALSGDKVNWEEVKKETITGAKRGAVDAASAFTGASAAKALGVGAEGASVASNVLRSGGAGAASGAVGSGMGATLEGKWTKDGEFDAGVVKETIKNVAKETVKGAGLGFVGGAAGSGAGQLFKPGSAGGQVATGFTGGAAAGGLGAAVEGKDIKEGMLVGGVAGAVGSLGQQKAPSPKGKTPPPKKPPAAGAAKARPKAPAAKPAEGAKVVDLASKRAQQPPKTGKPAPPGKDAEVIDLAARRRQPAPKPTEAAEQVQPVELQATGTGDAVPLQPVSEPVAGQSPAAGAAREPVVASAAGSGGSGRPRPPALKPVPASPAPAQGSRQPSSLGGKQGGSRSPKTGHRTLPPDPALPNPQASLKQRVAFLQRHRQHLGPKQQKMLDTLQKDLTSGPISARKRSAMSRKLKPWEDTAGKGIRQQHAARLDDAMPFPVKSVSKVQSNAGGEWEQALRSMAGETKPRLSMTSRTKDGAEVQIDAYDPVRRMPRELKSGRDLGSDPTDPTDFRRREFQERMERHAQFAQDHNLPGYEWVALTPEMADTMGVIRSTLPENLRSKIHIVLENVRD